MFLTSGYTSRLPTESADDDDETDCDERQRNLLLVSGESHKQWAAVITTLCGITYNKDVKTTPSHTETVSERGEEECLANKITLAFSAYEAMSGDGNFSSDQKQCGSSALANVDNQWNDWIPVLNNPKKKKPARREDSLNPPVTEDFSHPVFKKISQTNSYVNRMERNETIARLRRHGLFTGGSIKVLKKRLKTYYKQQKLAQDKIRTDTDNKYDYILVIDFEATCDSSNPDTYMHEIIEFPVVVIDCNSKEIIDSFQRYVCPKLNPKLTPFCINLTGIRQDQVKTADCFEVVMNEMWDWIQSKGYNKKMAILTDGPWDMSRFMYLQCQISKIAFPKWARHWINIRKSFSNFYDCKRQCLKVMLETVGLIFEGQPHSGLDDATNIARLALRLLNDGCNLNVNETLRQHKYDRNAAECRLSTESAPVQAVSRSQAEALSSSTEDLDSELADQMQNTVIT